MDLPSFLWLWRIAAWSMGLALLAYSILAGSGVWMVYRRKVRQPRPPGLRTFHLAVGLGLVVLVVGLLAIGIVGTLGQYGSLGHSPHGIMGGLVVALTLLSATSAFLIRGDRPWARPAHITLNILLGSSLLLALATGWVVVQKYLPEG